MLAIATITFDSNPHGADFYINDGKVSTTPYTTDLKSGEPYELTFKEDGYYTWSGTRSFNKDETFNKNLAKIFYKGNRGYLDLGYQAGSLSALYAALGFYVSGFNGEFAVKYGLQETDEIYFNPTSSPNKDYVVQKLRPVNLEGKIGYGFILGHDKFLNRLLVTPQVGASYTMVNGDKKLSTVDHSQVTYVVSGVAAVRLQFAVCRGVGINIMPSFNFAIKKGTLYEQMEKLSSKIKDWGTGMNLSASINFYF